MLHLLEESKLLPEGARLGPIVAENPVVGVSRDKKGCISRDKKGCILSYTINLKLHALRAGDTSDPSILKKSLLEQVYEN